MSNVPNYYDTSYPPSLWAPPPDPDPEPEPDPTLLIDPAFHTIDEIRTFINDTYPDLDDLTDAQVDGLQRVLDAERAGRNRSTLVAWLDEIEGLV